MGNIYKFLQFQLIWVKSKVLFLWYKMNRFFLCSHFSPLFLLLCNVSWSCAHRFYRISNETLFSSSFVGLPNSLGIFYGIPQLYATIFIYFTWKVKLSRPETSCFLLSSLSLLHWLVWQAAIIRKGIKKPFPSNQTCLSPPLKWYSY